MPYREASALEIIQMTKDYFQSTSTPVANLQLAPGSGGNEVLISFDGLTHLLQPRHITKLVTQKVRKSTEKCHKHIVKTILDLSKVQSQRRDQQTDGLYIDQPLAGLLKRLRIETTTFVAGLADIPYVENPYVCQGYTDISAFDPRLNGVQLKIADGIIHSEMDLGTNVHWIGFSNHILIRNTIFPDTYAALITKGSPVNKVIEHPDLVGLTIIHVQQLIGPTFCAPANPLVVIDVDNQTYFKAG